MKLPFVDDHDDDELSICPNRVNVNGLDVCEEESELKLLGMGMDLDGLGQERRSELDDDEVADSDALVSALAVPPVPVEMMVKDAMENWFGTLQVGPERQHDSGREEHRSSVLVF